ncbi:MAG: hypothetical protein GF409_07410 [Candidatus Omnitrophica bacterium]|nr:hypothetical protein [Candidatus Omnitrophota bacterium]
MDIEIIREIREGVSLEDVRIHEDGSASFDGGAGRPLTLEEVDDIFQKMEDEVYFRDLQEEDPEQDLAELQVMERVLGKRLREEKKRRHIAKRGKRYAA